MTESGGGTTYVTYYPFPMERTKRAWKIGLSTDDMEIELYPKDTDTVEGMTFAKAIRLGLFDRADVKVERAFWSKYPSSTAAKRVEVFTGKVGEVEAVGNVVTMRVEALLALLDIEMPRNLYQGPCPNMLFDSNCGLDRDSWDVAGEVGSGGGKKSIPMTGTAAGKADGWFSLGVVTFTSGVNAGISRVVKYHGNSTLRLNIPLGTEPAVGDNLTVWPGCNKTMTQCKNKFDNFDKFRGCPFIPAAENAA